MSDIDEDDMQYFNEDDDGSENEFDYFEDVEELDEDESDEESDLEEEVLEKGEIKRKWLPVMTPYEKAKIISKRTYYLNKLYESTIEDVIYSDNWKEYILEKGWLTKEKIEWLSNLFGDDDITESWKIATLEFELGKLPKYKIRREYPNGLFETWKHNDFKVLP